MKLIEEEASVEKLYDLNGTTQVASTEIYRCPSNKKATLEVLMFNDNFTNNLYLELWDDAANDSPNAVLTFDYNSPIIGWGQCSEEATINPNPECYIQDSSKGSWNKKLLPVTGGQYIKYSTSAVQAWRFIYRIIEEDL
ncbi:MAG: hypothetical protein V7784_21345 [Oceanospirillaceae bacterium]